MASEEKTGTLEELQEDMKQCGFHAPLECVMASARIQIDDALRTILSETKLPLYLFDYLITSVQADIRKADLDTERAKYLSVDKKE